MPSADITPGLAAVSQAFGLTIQDPEAPSNANGDANTSNGTNGTKSEERYVKNYLLIGFTVPSSMQSTSTIHESSFILGMR